MIISGTVLTVKVFKNMPEEGRKLRQKSFRTWSYHIWTISVSLSTQVLFWKLIARKAQAFLKTPVRDVILVTSGNSFSDGYHLRPETEQDTFEKYRSDGITGEQSVSQCEFMRWRAPPVPQHCDGIQPADFTAVSSDVAALLGVYSGLICLDADILNWMLWGHRVDLMKRPLKCWPNAWKRDTLFSPSESTITRSMETSFPWR